MVSLQDTCCLDISFDPENNHLIFSEDVTPAKSQKVMLSSLIPALLNKSLHYPELVYEEHIQVFNTHDRFIPEKGIYFDILCIPAGLLGVEYIRSHIYYAPVIASEDKCSTIVEVHHGVLTVIMQKNMHKDEFDIHTSVEEGLIVNLRKGEKLAVPQGYFYTFINTQEQPVVFVRIHKGSGAINYDLLRRERGLAYYCIRKNARREIVQNPIYRGVPRIKTIKPNAFLNDFGIESGISLYTQLRANTNSFVDALWG